MHPELEWRPAQGPGGLEGTIYRGRDAYERWLHEEVVPVWESYAADDLDFRELEDGRVLMIGHIRGRGRASGAEVSVPFGQIAEIKDGLVIRLIGYPDQESTLRAGGLDE
jgi:hypothetical protein